MDEIVSGPLEASELLLADGDLYVPGSRYGRSTAQCAPVAWTIASLISGECGEPVRVRDLHHAMGLVVNDHDDVAGLLADYAMEA